MIPSLNIAVFGSGRGSNFNAILDAMKRGEIPGARISLVVSNNSTAGILERARAGGIPAMHVSEKQYSTHDEFASSLLETLHAHQANLIVLAGYMKRVPSRVIDAYRNRIINIHPALLPSFGGQGMYGIHVHEAVIAAGERISGATVHLVDAEYDHGKILLQKQVDVKPDDTPETLAARVLSVEHEIYPQAIRMIAVGEIPSVH